MGAYLSEPVVEKISSDEKNDKLRLSYGASSMQGWRVSQEDAHNTILDFDTDTSLFAVFDGHGGHEVATYCALNLPDFIKKLDAYKKGDLIKALEEGYLEFDKTLTQESVIKALHVIAGNKSKDASSEEDPEEMNELYEEATMSIEELLLRYGSIKKDSEEEIEGRSKGSQLEHLMSKIRAKTQKSKSNSDGSTAQVLEPSQSDDEKPKDESDGVKCSKPQPEDHSEEKSLSVSEEESKKHDCDHKSKDKENGAKPEATHDPTEKETNSDEKVSQDNVNGTLLNGSSDHNGSSPASTTLPVKGKGKGVGKGLSNTIRKPVEKTPEELDLERKEAEKQAKRKERKESLRKKSGDELYKAMVTNEQEDEDESDMDDEEDADFDGESDSDDEQAEDDEDEWEDIDEEEEQEEVATKARNFSMNLKEEPGSDSGCTAVVALLRGNTLHVANAGDSRCVLSRKGRAIPLSADHKPEDEPERSRIERAGGVVTGDGRVNGGLNLSRAIGDHAYKQNTTLGPREQMITSLPDIQTIELEPGDDFIVLACDGIWNSKTNQQVVDFIRPRLQKGESLSDICNQLFDECLAPDTRGDGTGCDNMTGIIVRLDRFRTAEENADTTSASSQKRPHPDEATTGNSEAGSEDEASHRNKKQRVEEVKGEDNTSVDADSTAS